MPRKPFVLLSSRTDDAATANEYHSVLRHTGLAPEELVQVRMESAPFTPLDLDAVSGVLLGGSPYTASVPVEHQSDDQRRVEAELDGVLAEVRERDLPFLGMCFGIGTMGRFAGGVVDGTYGEQTSAAWVRLTEDGRADPLLAGLPERFQAYVGHKEACTMLPPGAVLLAQSDACPVQMFRLGENIYVTQFHPETDREALVTRIRIYRHAGYFPAEEMEAVIARVWDADVSTAHDVLRRFVERYARA